MQHALNLKLDHTQMDLAFQNYHFDQIQNQNRMEAAGQVSDKVQAQNKAGIVQGAAVAAPAGPAPAIDTKGMSHSQLSGLAKKELGL